MKKNKEFPFLALAFLVLWCPLFMGAWNKDKPSSSTSLRNSNPEMLANQSALETSFGAHHEFSTGGTNSGDNLRIKFNASISTPTNAANKMFIYGKDVSAVIEAHILDESGNELQITSGGDLFSSAGLTVTGASTFNGSITLGAGDDLIGSSTSDITFNTNKFTVAGATGNTVIAGTLGVTGVATLGDSSQMATSAAPTADADLANKKFVDDQWNPTAYVGGETVTIGNGLIIKMANAEAIGSVTFGTAFPNAVIAIVVTPTTASLDTENNGAAQSQSTSGFTLSGEGGETYNWIAIGH